MHLLVQCVLLRTSTIAMRKHLQLHSKLVRNIVGLLSSTTSNTTLDKKIIVILVEYFISLVHIHVQTCTDNLLDNFDFSQLMTTDERVSSNLTPLHYKKLVFILTLD